MLPVAIEGHDGARAALDRFVRPAQQARCLSAVLLVAKHEDREALQQVRSAVGRRVIDHDDKWQLLQCPGRHCTDRARLVMRGDDDCLDARRAAHAMPPLIEITWPVPYTACSDIHSAMSPATSSGFPARFIGTSRAIRSASNTAAVVAVAMTPGATALTVTPREATSSASAGVAPCSPALAAA